MPYAKRYGGRNQHLWLVLEVSQRMGLSPAKWGNEVQYTRLVDDATRNMLMAFLTWLVSHGVNR